MSSNKIYITSKGISYKIVNGDKWCIHKDTQQPVMLLKDYQDKLLLMANDFARKNNRNIPNHVLDEWYDE